MVLGEAALVLELRATSMRQQVLGLVTVLLVLTVVIAPLDAMSGGPRRHRGLVTAGCAVSR